MLLRIRSVLLDKVLGVPVRLACSVCGVFGLLGAFGVLCAFGVCKKPV